MKIKDKAKKNKHPSILIYGPAGTGKTLLATQAKNAYCFDFDNGLLSAVTYEDKFKEQRYECDYDTYIDDIPALPKVWMKSEKKMEEFQRQSSQGKLPFDTIIIDSLSGMAKCLQMQVMYMAMGDSFGKPLIQHWGSMVAGMEKVLTILRSFKCTLVVTAHEGHHEQDGLNLIRPLSITTRHGKEKLAWLFDEVLHTSLKPAGQGKNKFMISGGSTRSILARTRSTMVEPVEMNIGWEAIMDKMGYSKKGNE